MTVETYDYETWHTGSDQPATTSGTYATGQTLPARTPLGQVTATGEFVAWDPAAVDGSEVAVRMSAVAIDTTTGAANMETALDRAMANEQQPQVGADTTTGDDEEPDLAAQMLADFNAATGAKA